MAPGGVSRIAWPALTRGAHECAFVFDGHAAMLSCIRYGAARAKEPAALGSSESSKASRLPAGPLKEVRGDFLVVLGKWRSYKKRCAVSSHKHSRFFG